MWFYDAKFTGTCLPVLGEQTEAVLLNLGLSLSELDQHFSKVGAH